MRLLKKVGSPSGVRRQTWLGTMSTSCESPLPVRNASTLWRNVSTASWCCRDMAATMSAENAEMARKSCSMICLCLWDSGSPANWLAPDIVNTAVIRARRVKATAAPLNSKRTAAQRRGGMMM